MSEWIQIGIQISALAVDIIGLFILAIKKWYRKPPRKQQ